MRTVVFSMPLKYYQFVRANKDEHQVHILTTSSVKYVENCLSIAGLKSQMRKHVQPVTSYHEEILLEEAITLHSGQWHYYQDNTPVNSILVTVYLTRWTSNQFLTLPIIQTLLPATSGYSLMSVAVVMRQLRRWKRLWRRSLTPSPKRTSNDTTSFLAAGWDYFRGD